MYFIVTMNVWRDDLCEKAMHTCMSSINCNTFCCNHLGTRTGPGPPSNTHKTSHHAPDIQKYISRMVGTSFVAISSRLPNGKVSFSLLEWPLGSFLLASMTPPSTRRTLLPLSHSHAPFGLGCGGYRAHHGHQTAALSHRAYKLLLHRP